jgi:hypothetical protein
MPTERSAGQGRDEQLKRVQEACFISVAQRENVLGVVERNDSADERAVLEDGYAARPPYQHPLG